MILNIFPHSGHIRNLLATIYFYSLNKSIVLNVIKDYKLGRHITIHCSRSYNGTFWKKWMTAQ